MGGSKPFTSILPQNKQLTMNWQFDFQLKTVII